VLTSVFIYFPSEKRYEHRGARAQTDIYEQRDPTTSGNLPKLGSNKVCSLPLIVGLAFDDSDDSCIFLPAQ
jgi:hypothetical protein